MASCGLGALSFKKSRKSGMGLFEIGARVATFRFGRALTITCVGLAITRARALRKFFASDFTAAVTVEAIEELAGHFRILLGALSAEKLGLADGSIAIFVEMLENLTRIGALVTVTWFAALGEVSRGQLAVTIGIHMSECLGSTLGVFLSAFASHKLFLGDGSITIGVEFLDDFSWIGAFAIGLITSALFVFLSEADGTCQCEDSEGFYDGFHVIGIGDCICGWIGDQLCELGLVCRVKPAGRA